MKNCPSESSVIFKLFYRARIYFDFVFVFLSVCERNGAVRDQRAQPLDYRRHATVGLCLTFQLKDYANCESTAFAQPRRKDNKLPKV